MEVQYNRKDLAKILRELASYVESSNDHSYFDEVVATGLFHDACGKIINRTKTAVLTITDY